jgi:hypothetical protein
MKLTEPIPDLAIALALSPLDIALHDAYGRLHEKNSFDCFTHEHVGSDLSHWLGEEFVGKDFSEIIAPQTAPTLFLYHLVGSLDPLSKDDLSRKIGDGLPETLEEWIRTISLENKAHWKRTRCGRRTRRGDRSNRYASFSDQAVFVFVGLQRSL